MDANSAVVALPTRPASKMATMTGPEFTGYGFDDEGADEFLGPIFAEADSCLERQNGTDEEAQNADDGQGSVAREEALFGGALQDTRCGRKHDKGASRHHETAAEGVEKVVNTLQRE